MKGGVIMDKEKAFYMSALSGALAGALAFFKADELPSDIVKSIEHVHRYFVEQSSELNDLFD